MKTGRLASGFGQLRPDLNPLDVRFLSNCGRGPNGRKVAAFIGPCFDSATCKIPRCCGIISGKDSLYRLVYEAEVPFSNGTYNGKLGGICIVNPFSDGDLLTLTLPTSRLLLSSPLAGYRKSLCEQTTCPQEVGKTYTIDIPFRVVTSVITLFRIIKFNFISEIITENGQSALCWGLSATFVDAELANSKLSKSS
ncbi:hypothetical protein Bhyg_06015 [Pseudolycoriella hygida]|uniref:Uncharacterized protein n=1 Tax=Pseudolycoriella hygida TaxID=35572 RepID=A0A9Q0N0S1_9DIPT|nr:hypothetical protein Bhyg_06015 [Pseudolycoriella hygida]